MKQKRVKITKCSGKGYWYKNSIGNEFDVYDTGVKGFVVKSDYDLGHRAQWRHIDRRDCKTI